MVDKLWHKAKAFIGLADEEEMSNESYEAPIKEEGVKLENNLLKFKPSKKSNGNDNDYEIMIYEPRAYEDSLAISARLRGGDPVVVNLKYLDPAEGTRLIDFVCGTAFAIDGHMTKISDTIFILSPNMIGILQGSDGSPDTAAGEDLIRNRM